MLPPRSNLRGIAAMVFATGSFVICDSFMKLATEDLPPFEVLFVRGIAATLCCGTLLVALGQWRAVAGILNPVVLARGGFETASVLCYIVALASMPIADVIAISQTAPLLLILLDCTDLARARRSAAARPHRGRIRRRRDGRAA